MKKPVDVTPRDMFRDESMQRVHEGLKLSASCAKELNQLLPRQGWGKVSEQLHYMMVQCRKLSQKRALTRQALLQQTDIIALQNDTDARR